MRAAREGKEMNRTFTNMMKQDGLCFKKEGSAGKGCGAKGKVDDTKWD
jgi:hypothetical protein